MNTTDLQLTLGTLVRINVPQWFQDPDFIAWLNNDKPKMTWHRGGQPHEFSDVMVLVSPELGGDGTDSDMPHHEELVELLRQRGVPTGDDLHIAVWLSNV